MKPLLAVLALAVVATAIPAQAHFKEPVPLGWDEWANRQWSVGGNRCCDPTDVWLFSGEWRYEFETGGTAIVGVTLVFDGGREIYVPKSRFVDRTLNDGDDINPTGNAVVWYKDIENIYCFDPPGPLA